MKKPKKIQVDGPVDEQILDDIDVEKTDDTSTESVAPAPKVRPPKRSLKDRIKNLSKPKKAIILSVIALIVLLFVVPVTRYAILGVFIQKDVSFSVLDSMSGAPVTEATVTVAGKTAKTDNEGIARIDDIKVGEQTVTIEKKYYTSVTQTTVIDLGTKALETKLVAEGLPVQLKVVNTVTKAPAENVTISAGESKAVSDGDGKAVLVVPVDTETVELTLEGEGYAKTTATFAIADVTNKETTVAVAPVGKVYFLSKQSGKIDVVKSNLDGSDRKIVVPGTGFESDSSTVLLASRDWKYVVLSAKRDTRSDYAALYLINTTDDSMTVLDEGNASFAVHGWSGHTIVYTVDRLDVDYSQSDKYRLKSFNADNDKLTVLDTTTSKQFGPGRGYDNYYYDNRFASTYIGFVSITADKVLYAKYANFSGVCDQTENGIYTINPDGTSKQAVVEGTLSNLNLYGAYTYKPGEIYYASTKNACTNNSQVAEYFEYIIGGEIETIEGREFTVGQESYRTFLVSPNGQEVFWADARDGKNVFFIGNLEMENGKEVARLENFQVYGWYGQDYLLVTKNNSELYVMSRAGGEPVKITDYHKLQSDFRGYGYGYGGL